MMSISCNISGVDSFPVPPSTQDQDRGGGGGLDLLLSPDHLLLIPSNNRILLRSTPTDPSGSGVTPPATLSTSFSLGSTVVSAAGAGVHASAPGIFVCTTDTNVFLLHWDALLGEWERIVISEGEGRIGSVVLLGEPGGKRLWVGAFKWETIVIYLLTSFHLITERGPLLLESIQELGRLDKSKEPTTAAHAILLGIDTLLLLGLSHPLSIKMWEVDLDSGKGRLLKQQGAGLSMKSVVASDLILTSGGDHFLLIVSSEGAAEVFHLLPSGFSLLNRFRVAEDAEPGTEEYSEWRVLGAKFFSGGEAKGIPEEPEVEQDDDGDHDAKNFRFVPNKRPQFPQLLLIAITTRGISLLNAKSGHILLLLHYHALFPPSFPLGEGVVAMEAAISGGTTGNGIILALHPLFSESIHLLNFDLGAHLKKAALELASGPSCSLMTSDVLQPKSVLRKRFKSPTQSRNANANAIIPYRRRKSHTRRPAWVTKVRSRPSPPAGNRKKVTRSQSPVSHIHSSYNTEVVPLPRKGSWEDEKNGDPSFGDRLKLGSGLMGGHSGHSYLRLAMTQDGGLLAGGGSQSPIALMRTRHSWETVRLFKDISRVTSLHFNFQSNLLLVGSNDGRTRIISVRSGKEMLSWEFSSKFNEHVHSQFYFMDKFVLQPELNSLVLYALREEMSEFKVKTLTKLQAATFPVHGAQSITALAAPNRFLSGGILTGLSNKGLELFDANAERVVLSIRSAHSKPVTCIRLNDAPVSVDGGQTSHLSDLILTSAPCHLDPIKLWDIRTGSPALRLSDVINGAQFIGSARPALSPCGRFIATGCEDGALVVYDTRRMAGRLRVGGGLGSTVLDCIFDPSSPIIWAACRNGAFWKFS